MNVFDLTGRAALVTGAARGLGAGMAEALARAGADVVVADRLGDLAAETAEKIGASGARAVPVTMDVTDEESWERAAATTVDELGGFDILVNNAGIEISSLLVDIDPDDLRRMLEVNVVGTTLGMKHGLPRHAPRRQRRGTAAPSSTSPPSPRPSRSPASPDTRRRSPRSTGSPASPPSSPASSATACA